MASEIAYAEITSAASVTATVEAGDNVVITCANVVCDGSTYLFEFNMPWWGNTTSQSNMYLELFMDGVVVWRFWDGRPFSAGVQIPGVMTGWEYTPTAGTHTFTLQGHVDGGTGLVECAGGGPGFDLPAYLSIRTLSGDLELAFATNTSAVNLTGTTEGTANTLVTLPAVTFTGSQRVVIEFYCPWASNTATSGQNKIILTQDGTSLGNLWQGRCHTAGQIAIGGFTVSRRFTPSAGSHTYAIKGYSDNGGGFVNAGPGGSSTQYAPMLARIVQVN